MAQSQRSERSQRTTGGILASGGVAFAGVLMLVYGILAILQGISAIAADDVWARVGSYVYEINITGWGWALVVLGAVAAVTGAGILRDSRPARAVGIALAAISVVVQFLLLPYVPVWAVIMIAIDVFVIWALAVYEPSRARL
ncbi:hypothetical protein [Streptomyces sp. NPDC086787]|uniref:DUF7144 family membrane protein n=1 Tax=Streptomyces sp. NPDC086787 TaxID=3365759 RepID=UPI00381A820F